VTRVVDNNVRFVWLRTAHHAQYCLCGAQWCTAEKPQSVRMGLAAGGCIRAPSPGGAVF
jgi:hypothetical protein